MIRISRRLFFLTRNVQSAVLHEAADADSGPAGVVLSTTTRKLHGLRSSHKGAGLLGADRGICGGVSRSALASPLILVLFIKYGARCPSAGRLGELHIYFLASSDALTPVPSHENVLSHSHARRTPRRHSHHLSLSLSSQP